MPNFRHRLPRGRQREYDRSNAVSSIPLRVSHRLTRAVELLAKVLPERRQPVIERIAQAVADEVCDTLHVPKLRVHVRGTRPSNTRGELHGLYSPDHRQDRIEVWMITAKRGQVVAFKTFLRTLLHEICHHLDYELLHLRVSLHTDGFFKRESSLFSQMTRQLATGAAPRASDEPRDAIARGLR
jgi:hypothetical protein